MTLKAAPLAVDHIYKTFPKGKTKENVVAVKDVSFTINPGEIVAFLGANGAGKTTTIKLIAGLISPDSGEVRINGKNPLLDRSVYSEFSILLDQHKYAYARRRVADSLCSFGVLKGLSYARSKRRAQDLLHFVGLSEKADAECRTLSKGMEQKLNLAVCLISEPKLLLLDEPTNGLDVEATQQMIGRLRDLVTSCGLSILLTTHMLDVAQTMSDRVVVIDRGSIIAQDTTQALLKRFSGEIYKIRFSGKLSNSQQLALSKSAVVSSSDAEIILPGNSQKLYQVLALLQPLPIISVTTGDTSLTDVFLKLIGGSHV